MWGLGKTVGVFALLNSVMTSAKRPEIDTASSSIDYGIHPTASLSISPSDSTHPYSYQVVPAFSNTGMTPDATDYSYLFGTPTEVACTPAYHSQEFNNNGQVGKIEVSQLSDCTWTLTSTTDSYQCFSRHIKTDDKIKVFNSLVITADGKLSGGAMDADCVRLLHPLTDLIREKLEIILGTDDFTLSGNGKGTLFQLTSSTTSCATLRGEPQIKPLRAKLRSLGIGVDDTCNWITIYDRAPELLAKLEAGMPKACPVKSALTWLDAVNDDSVASTEAAPV